MAIQISSAMTKLAEQIWQQRAVKKSSPRKEAFRTFHVNYRSLRSRETHGFHLEECGKDGSTYFVAPEQFESLAALLARWKEAPPLAEEVLEGCQTQEEILQDLKALKAEYKKDFKVVSGVISVVMGPITLGDEEADVTINLGRFKVSYNTQDGRILAEALEPNPPAENENVTHPHVFNNTFCLGDATDAVEEAKSQARIADLFSLLKAVLENHSPKDSFVKLEDWESPKRTCHHCNVRMHEDDSYYCEACDEDVCENHYLGNDLCTHCGDTCKHCDSTCHTYDLDNGLCEDCRGTCDKCGYVTVQEELTITDDTNQSFCENCIRECRECKEFFAKINDNGYCATCQENLEEAEHAA